MCGICGYISTNIISREQLTVMNDSMFHRGPDDSGVELYDAGSGFTVGLAQRRLSILDLSPLGHQPMDSEGGRLSIVYNGEIYNFGEIRKELSDYPFKSTCDTEVILAAYLKWGEKCLDKMDGMFALAIYDREKKEIFFARDRIGKKPLYYWLCGDTLVFASELKPIMLC
ncbi:MAG: asparagine synthetase B, partial [Lachnospiraceae bacterium]|nr:asparagine synthetase B [Lachnospiraceae bacterium]